MRMINLITLRHVWTERRRFCIRAFNSTYGAISGMPLIIKQLLKDHLPDRVVDFLANKVLPENRRSPRNRRYIRNGSRTQLLKEMKQRQIRYTLLRWFEDLPDWPEGEDMDFLIHGEDIHKVQDLFQLKQNSMPVDIYSHDGSGGLSYNGFAYYSPKLANRLIEEADYCEQYARIPAKELYFASLAYHAVYHKFHRSGLPLKSGLQPQFDEPENPYPALLARMSNELGLGLDCSLLDLHCYLEEKKLAPSFDLFRKLSNIKPELSFFLKDDAHELCPVEKGEVVAFVVRDWAIENGFLDKLRREIESNLKLEILYEMPLHDEQKKNVRQEIRGGDWGKGPHPVGGGGPAVFWLCFDYHPVPATEKLTKVHPYIRNGNITHFKEYLRNYVEQRTLITKHANPLHSADDEIEAWHYLEVVAPNKVRDLKQAVFDIRKSYDTEFPVIELLPSYRSRAKLELIEYEGQKAVKKTFRLSALDYFTKELSILEKFSEKCPYIPNVLLKGENYFIIPYYENILMNISEQEKNNILRNRGAEIVDILKFFYTEGYSLMDFNANNVLITPENDLIVIDFEYVHKYREKPSSFLNAFDIAGVPQKDDGTFLDGVSEQCLTYKDAWASILGPLSRYI